MVNMIPGPGGVFAERMKSLEANIAGQSTQQLSVAGSQVAGPVQDASGSSYAFNNNVPGSSPVAVWVGGDSQFHFGKNVSSIRYKENVRAHNIDPANVLELQPVLYDMIGGTAGFYGLIAEQVAEHVPELIQWYDGHIDAVRYDLLAVPLLSVAQNHDGRIAALESQVAALTAQVQSLLTQVQAPVPQWSPPAVTPETYAPPAYAPNAPAPAAPSPEPTPLPYTIQP